MVNLHRKVAPEPPERPTLPREASSKLLLNPRAQTNFAAQRVALERHESTMDRLEKHVSQKLDSADPAEARMSSASLSMGRAEGKIDEGCLAQAGSEAPVLCPPMEASEVSTSTMRKLYFTLACIAVLILVVQAVLWNEWFDMAEDSIRTPAQQMLGTYAKRVDALAAKIVKWARFCVTLLDQAADTQELPSLSTAVAASCGTYNCSGFTSGVVQNATHLCTAVAYLVGLATLMADVPFVGIGLEDGTMMAATRTNGVVYAKLRDAQNLTGRGTGYITYGVDASTGCFNLSDVVSEAVYDPRSRPWYSNGKTSPNWGEGVYTDFSTATLVLSATHPLYALDSATGAPSSTLIGVHTGDCRLEAISTQLAQLHPGKTGHTYVVEADANGYLIGASEGALVEGTQRLSPASSNSGVIKSSYDFLVNNYINSSSGGLTTGAVVYTGDIVSGTAMVDMITFADTTGHLDWRAVVAIPVTDYYLFIRHCMWITGGFALLSLALMVRLVSMPHVYFKDSRLVTDLVVRNLRRSITNNIVGCISIGCILWVTWLVYTKLQTDIAVNDALKDAQRNLAEELTWRWEEYPLLDEVSIMSYVIGALPLASADPTMGSTGKLLDLHFSTQMNITGTMAGIAVGFENGDLLGMQYKCRYDSSCTDDSWMVSLVRSASTALKLVTCNTTAHASGNARIRNSSHIVSNNGIYSATNRPWYEAAVAAGKATNSRYGNAVLTGVYFWNKTVIVSTAQAFYDSAGTLVGVVETDVDFVYLSKFLESTVPQSTQTSQAVLVQQLGEVLAASDLVTTLSSSDGGTLRLNVTNTEMSRIKSYANEILQDDDYTNFIMAQNSSNKHGSFIEAAASCSSYFTQYTFLADALSKWTYLQAYSRQVYLGSLDKGTERNFVIIVFSFAAIGYICSKMIDHVASGMQTQQQKRTKLAKQMGDHHEVDQSAQRIFVNELISSRPEGVMDAVTSPRHGLCVHKRYDQVISEDVNKKIAIALKVSPTHGMRLALLDHHGQDPAARIVLFRLLESLLREIIDKFDCEEHTGLGDSLLCLDPRDARRTDTRSTLLRAKAVEFVRIAEKGRPVFKALKVQASFGEHSWQWRLYCFLNGRITSRVIAGFSILFILCAFVEDRESKSIAAIACLVPYTLDVTANIYLHPSWSLHTAVPMALCLVLWVTTLLAFDASIGSERGVILLEDFFRPWMLLIKHDKLRDALKLLGLCLYDARSIFFYLFTVIAISGIIVNLIFWERFDSDLGQTVDTFLDSFVYMFIFLTSGENWDVLVYQGYRVDKWSGILWIFLSLFGIFALVSMVIATFETTYTNHKDKLQAFRIANEAIARNIAFQCLTWDLPLQTTSKDIQEEERRMEYFKELPNVRLEDFLEDFMDSEIFDIDARVNPLLWFAGHTSGKQYANAAQLEHDTRVSAALKVMIVLQDVDDNLSITLQEFEEAIVAAKCTVHLRGDVLIAAEAMVLRAAELVKQTKDLICGCPAWERKIKLQLKENLVTQEGRLHKVMTVHHEVHAVVQGLVGISPGFSLDRLDVLMVTLMLIHGFWLSLWGTTNQDMIRTIAAVFAFLYLSEVVLRVRVVKGLQGFFNDRRGATYQFQNGLMLCLAAFGTVAQTLAYVLPSRYDPLCQGLAAMQLWRILAVEKSFRRISHAFFLGLKPVQLFIGLLLLVMFTYCVFATYFFHDVSNADGTMSFKTLEDTCLTMHQVFIGEGWHSVMQDSVDRTNKALIWFFASYVLVVGVLFSNLFVGILINQFQYGTKMYSTLGGRVRLEMSQYTPDCSEAQFERMLLNLGHIAEIIHFPGHQFHEHLVTKYKDRIELAGGGLQRWASQLVISGFRRVLHNATVMGIRRLEGNLPKSLSGLACKTAMVEAARRAGISDCAEPCGDDPTLYEILHEACAILHMDSTRSSWMLAELTRRRAQYLRLFEQRKLAPAEKLTYCGIPDPSRVPCCQLRLLVIFYRLLFASEDVVGTLHPNKEMALYVTECAHNLTRTRRRAIQESKLASRDGSRPSRNSEDLNALLKGSLGTLEKMFPCPWMDSCGSLIAYDEFQSHIHTYHHKSTKETLEKYNGQLAEGAMTLKRKSASTGQPKARWDWLFECDGQLFCVSTRRDQDWTLYLVPYMLGAVDSTDKYIVELSTDDGVDGFAVSTTQRPVHSPVAHYDIPLAQHIASASLVIRHSNRHLLDPDKLLFRFRIGSNPREFVPPSAASRNSSPASSNASLSVEPRDPHPSGAGVMPVPPPLPPLGAGIGGTDALPPVRRSAVRLPNLLAAPAEATTAVSGLPAVATLGAAPVPLPPTHVSDSDMNTSSSSSSEEAQ